jgi:uncharacterized OsmC-like protein
MASDPRRISKIEAHIQIKLNADAPDKAKQSLERIVHLCPVARSLHPDIVQDVHVTFL